MEYDELMEKIKDALKITRELELKEAWLNGYEAGFEEGEENGKRNFDY